MNQNQKCKLKEIFVQLFCAALMIVSVVPGYVLLGDFIKQILVTTFVTFVFVSVANILFKVKAHFFSNALMYMTIFWVTFAIIEQIIFHVQNKNASFFWYQLFYYDRPALIFIVFFVCVFYFIFKLLLKNNDSAYLDEYRKFIKKSVLTFIVYYILVLIYSLFLIRRATFVRPVINLKPFDMIRFTFTRGYIDYELLILFLGNIALFIPLGLLVSVLTKKKPVVILFPFLVSFLIELSQYFLGNGHPDIDDFILNVFGYFIGVIIKMFFDFLINKATKGRIKSIFSV